MTTICKALKEARLLAIEGDTNHMVLRMTDGEGEVTNYVMLLSDIPQLGRTLLVDGTLIAGLVNRQRESIPTVDFAGMVN